MEETDDPQTQKVTEVLYDSRLWSPRDKILFSFTSPASWKALPVPSVRLGLPAPSLTGSQDSPNSPCFMIHKEQRLMPKRRSPGRLLLLKDRIREYVMDILLIIFLEGLIIRK